MKEQPRYAIYYAPHPDTALWRFGSAMLGYDALVGAPCPLLPLADVPENERKAMAADPARYGFHATLKAPFELAPEVTRSALLSDTAKLAATTSAFAIRPLMVARLDGFVALLPCDAEDGARLTTLADTVVRRLDHLRAPLSETDRSRRLASRLSPRQIELLDRWGYPYTEEQFRFHMTLTGRLDPDIADRIGGMLAGLLEEEIGHELLEIDSIAVFEQPSRDAPFRIVARYPLG